MPMPYAPPEWWQQRDTSRRNRRIVDLKAGLRLAQMSGDEAKAQECYRKIREIQHHMGLTEGDVSE